jgi:hypothetical protein
VTPQNSQTDSSTASVELEHKSRSLSLALRHIECLASNSNEKTAKDVDNSRSPQREFISARQRHALNDAPGYAALSPMLALISSPKADFPEVFVPSTVMLNVDTGASVSITPDLSDLTTKPRPVQPTLLQGIASGLQVLDIGTAQYTFLASDGTEVTLHLHDTLYVPGCPTRLLCPRHLAAVTGIDGDGFLSFHQTATLSCHGHELKTISHEVTGLPILYARIPSFSSNIQKLNNAAPTAAQAISTPTMPLPASTSNLSNSQRLKLMWHERCNHRSMATINQWKRNGLLPVDCSVASCPDPICVACQYGKAHRKNHAKMTQLIAATCTYPGQGVSADQLEAGYPGKIPTTRGLPTHKRYKFCNIGVDHYSRYVFPTFHETKHASELIASKRSFDTFTAKYNIRIEKIRADNGVYLSAPFQFACDVDNQGLSFCAIGGHWQNSVAERHIGVITETARTLLLHAIRLWPNVINEEF